TINVINSAGTAFVHSDVYIINKAKLIAGGALVYATDFTIVHGPCPANFNIGFAPCVTFGQTPATGVNYIIDTGWYGGPNPGDTFQRFARISVINGVGAAATLDCLGDANFILENGCYNFNIAGANQPSACTAINTNSFNISSPGVVRNGKIWFAHTVGADV